MGIFEIYHSYYPMRKHTIYIRMTMIIIATLFYSNITAQSTYSQVYSILQTNCTFSSCHDNTSPKAQMSLIGAGGDPQGDVYNTLVEQTPTNSFAAGNGYVRINPGDPHTSFLFRKINKGFDAHMVLDSLEGNSMPSMSIIPDVDKELIRQWILFGAPETGIVVDTLLLQEYYSNGGIETVPVPPSAPNPGEGMQIHVGPFFVPPGQEQEYFLKFDPGFTDTVESAQIDILMGSNSHHFILEQYNLGEESNFQEGYRLDGAHLSTKGVTAAQFASTTFLPQNTAFLLAQDAWLDLNSHYINFSLDSILKAEVYVNIHTQPNGTAKQIMHSLGALGGISFPNILNVPNDGATYTFESSFHNGTIPLPMENDVYIWSMNSHTHQWGTDFDIYKRTSVGARGEHLFDASNLNADPLGTDIGYDYSEPPSRVFDPFLFVPKTEGFIFEASYVNTGTANNVGWGLTSEDEMFIMGFFYVLDTTGLSTVGVPEVGHKNEGIVIYPNPAQSAISFDFREPIEGTMKIYNVLGKLVMELPIKETHATMDVSHLSKGVYIYHILSDKSIKPGRFTIAH